MIGRIFFQMARVMSRRNGISVARSLIEALQEFQKSSVSPSGDDLWPRILQTRRGWRQVSGGLFEYKTGDRLEWKSGKTFTDFVHRVTSIEVKSLGQGLPPEAQKQLVADALEAAAGVCAKALAALDKKA